LKINVTNNVSKHFIYLHDICLITNVIEVLNDIERKYIITHFVRQFKKALQCIYKIPIYASRDIVHIRRELV